MKNKANMLLVFSLLFLTLLVGFSSASLCYQESANLSTSCGGLATGSYGGHYSEAIDGDWISYANTSFNQTIYVNYTKPVLATNNSLLQVKLDSGAIKSAIPSACLNQNKLQIKINITSYITIEDYEGENSPNINGVYTLIDPANELYYNNQEDNSFYIYSLASGCFNAVYGGATGPTFGISRVSGDYECIFYNNDFSTPAGIYSAYDPFFASGSGLATENFNTTISCYTGSDWQIINNSFGSGLIYEEAMLWDFTDSANLWKDNGSLIQSIDNCGILTTPNAIYTLNSSIDSSADYITKNYITVLNSGMADPDISGNYYQIGSYNGNLAYYNGNYYMFYAEGVYNIGNYLGSGILFNNFEANPFADYSAYNDSASGWARTLIASEVKCIEIKANNITFNMNGKSILGDNSLAIDVISSSGNSYVSIFNGTVGNFGSEDNQAYGIYLGSGENNTLENINLVNNNYNLYLHNTGFNNFKNINLTYGEVGLYAYEVYSSIFSNINSSANGVGLFLEKSIENSFNNALLQFNGWGLRLEQNSLRNRFYNAYISNSSEYSLLSFAWNDNLNNFLIYNNSYGRIEYSLIGSIVSNLIGENIRINNNSASVDSSAIPELNISANVTLYGLSKNMIAPKIYKNGVVCLDCVNFTSLNAGSVKFRVSGWSNYSIRGVASVINCTSNAECGTNAFIGSNFCSSGNVFRSFRTYTCNNAGTTASYCSNVTNSVLNKTCANGCSNGNCLPLNKTSKKADLALWNPTDGKWYVRDAANTKNIIYGFSYGVKGMTPVSGDYDGDNRSDLALWNPTDGKWYVYSIAKSKNLLWNVSFGNSNLTPVSGDYDGDGKNDLALWNPTDGKWYIRNSANTKNIVYGVAWGSKGMTPVSGDYDGDKKSDLALWNPTDGKWYVRDAANTKNIVYGLAWGSNGMKSVSGDYDGDGKSDLALWNPTEGKWYVRDAANTKNIVYGTVWGSKGMTPVSGDYNGS